MQMPPDQPPNAGSEQILNCNKQSWPSRRVPSSTARTRSPFVPRGGGEPLRDAGKYVTIYRRKDSGRWLMAYDIWNSNGPSPV